MMDRDPGHTQTYSTEGRDRARHRFRRASRSCGTCRDPDSPLARRARPIWWHCIWRARAYMAMVGGTSLLLNL